MINYSLQALLDVITEFRVFAETTAVSQPKSIFKKIENFICLYFK